MRKSSAARFVFCAFICGFWLAVLPASAQADTCQERAQYIGTQIVAGNVGNATEADPDCDRGGVVSALIAFGAATATAVIAVATGLQGAGPGVAAGYGGAGPATGGGGTGGAGAGPGGGGATGGGPTGTGTSPGSGPGGVGVSPGSAGPTTGPTTSGPSGPSGPTTTDIVSGNKAIDILTKMGLIKGVPDPADPSKIIGYVPTSGFDNLGGTPTQRTVGVMTDPATNVITNVQNQTINRVSGIGFQIDPATGRINPNQVVITVETNPPDNWTAAPPSTPAPPLPPVPPSGPTPPTTTPTTPTTPPTTTSVPPTTTTVPPTPPAPPAIPPSFQTVVKQLQSIPGGIESVKKTISDNMGKFELARLEYKLDKESAIKDVVDATGMPPAAADALLGMSRDHWAMAKAFWGLVK